MSDAYIKVMQSSLSTFGLRGSAPYQHLLVIELRVDLQWRTPSAQLQLYHSTGKGVWVGQLFL